MNDKWYNNIFGTGTNIFGAGPSGSVRSLLDAKLITPESVEKAQKRSMSRGLLTGLASYLAQPKNQNFGSALPYIGKAYLAANTAAQSPFEGITDKYLIDTQIAENQRVQKEKARSDKQRDQISLVIDDIISKNPNLAYLRNAPDAQRLAAVEEYTKKQLTPTTPKELNLKERLTKLMTIDSDPNQTLTPTQIAEMKSIQQILSVDSPTGQTFSGINLPKAPDGYYYDRTPDGKLKTNELGRPYVVPVAGSAEALKREKEKEKEEVAQEGKATIAQTVVVDAQRALDLIDEDHSTTGLDAWALRQIPSTKAYALDQMVKSIQANIGIDKLLDIKASGAGLGQVPQSQLEMLASVLGQLNTAQDRETVRYNVQRVLELYSDIVRKAGGEKALASAIEASKQTPERQRLESNSKTRKQEEQDLLNKYK